MDPYFSQHRDHVPYPYNQYTSWEGRPPQVRLEPPKQPLYFGPCPYDGSTSQLNPADFNLCGSHGYPPGYYSYRPPYSHFQPPSQLYYHGHYPPYPDAYPAYFVPPPHHPVDQARYNYEKGKRHCCGCPNHVCHGGYDNSVKIEEQKPEIERNNNDSSGLIRFPNYPYPVVWVPPGYIKDSKRTSDAQPEPSSRWIPLGMDNLKGLRSGEDEVGRLKSGQKVTPSPWPIIWIPGHGNAEEEIKDSKELKAKPEIREEVSLPEVKIVPLTYVDDEKLEKPGGIKDQNESCLHWEATKEKEGNTKSIPVIQKKEDEGKKYGKFGMNETQEKTHTESKATIPDKKEDNGASSRIKQSPPDKSSKLPPVCLRVDPLPKKKSANGSSRSPTLPSRSQQDNKEQLPCQKGANKEISNKEICIVDAKDRPLSQIEKKVNQKTIPVVYLKGSPENMEEESQNKDEQKAKGVERKASEDGKLNEGAHILEENKAGKEFSGGRKVDRKRHLSESDAAVLIQAAYRGYQVRKLQPLEKLRKIMLINEQVQNVRRQIQSFEVSPERQEMKQRMVFGETIMNLLLQLDAIQGLHSSVREARKSVAKELIHLQENLDCLARESISEHESATSRELVTDRNLEEQASVASIPRSSGPASDQLQIVKAADGNHATEPAYSDKIEVDASVSHLEMGAEGEEKISASGVYAECRDGIVSPACRDHKEAPDSGEGIESELVSEEPAFRLVEATNPSVGTEMQEVPSVNRDGILYPEVEEQGKAEGEGASIGEQMQEVTSAYRDVALSPKVEERGGMEVISSVEELVSGSHTSTKCDQDLEESSEILVARRCLEKAAESDLASNDMKMVEPQSGEAASDSGVALCTLADTERSLEQSSESSNLDAVIKVRETMASNSAVPAELSPVELIPDSDVAPHLADDKQVETQMMPLAEGSCCAENDSIIVDSTCDAVSVCLEAGSETLTSEDVVKVEKNLEMKESNDVVKPDKNLNIQESTDLGRAAEDASEVIKSNNMQNLVETPDEPCFGKVEGSTVEQDRPHLEDKAAFKEVDTEGTKEVEGEFSHHNISTPCISLASLDNLSKKEKKLMEDDKKLRATLQELLEAGNQQLAIISGLDERVKDLERRLAQKKRVKIMRHKPKKST